MDPARVLDAVAGPALKLPLVPGWRVESVAGEGGMGLVWRGVRERDGAEGAIKLAAGRDLDVVERIEAEADALRALEHANIVRLLDAGPMEDGGLFLAMEFVHGPPLSHIIPPGGLPEEKVFAIFRNIAAAVEHAHSRGILHRDLKPANVLLCTRTMPPGHDGKGGDFFAKVADFGMAKPVHERVQRLSLTHTGLVAGTAEYIPPEAYLQGHMPDKAGDIYALGVILFEMLSGTPPRGAWQPVSQQRRVDARLDEVLAKAMHAQPEQRWKSAGAMLAAVEEILHTPPRYAGTPMISQATRVADFVWTVAGLAVLFLTVCTAMRLDNNMVAPPVDLIGDFSKRLGGFRALFFLLVLFAPVCAWQVVRLWRFRRVPLREALPAAFGARLGTGRTAACVAAATQLLCVVLPAVYLCGIYFETGTLWLKKDSPPWATGLCVTPWGGRWEQVPDVKIPMAEPWSLPRLDEYYWLCEYKGPPHLPASLRRGRAGFLPFITPAIMVASASLAALAMAGVCAAGLHSWWLHRRWTRAALLVLAASSFTLLGAAAWQVEQKRVLRETHPARDDGHTRATVPEAVKLVLEHYHADRGGELRPLPAKLLETYAEVLNFRDHGKIPRSKIPELLEAERLLAVAENRRHFAARCDYNQRPPREGKDAWSVKGTLNFTECTDPPHGAALAHIAAVRISQIGKCRPHAEERIFTIESETVTREIIYEAESRGITPGEAQEWHGRFVAALATAVKADAGDALDACFHEKILSLIERYASTNPAAQLSHTERNARTIHTLRSRPGLAPAGSVQEGIERLPGGRSRVRFPMRDAQSGEVVMFAADLALIGGRWQCVQLTF